MNQNKIDFTVVMMGALFGYAIFQYSKGYRPQNGGDPLKTVSMGVRG